MGFALESGPPTLLRCELLRLPGVVHGFSTRWGAAGGPELDFGAAAGAAARRQHVALFARAVGFAPAALYTVRQVHGRRVVCVGQGDRPASVREVEADALATARRGAAVAVLTADCVPVLLATRRHQRAVAAVHAGWRGAAAGVLQAAVSALGQLCRRDPAELDICAAVGPHIGPAVYEVGDEVAQAFAAVPGAVRAGDATRLDLGAVARAALADAGVAHVEHCGRCTFDEPELFFSYRRDGAATGRQLAVIGLDL